MVSFNVQLIGVEQCKHLLITLPKNVEKEVDKTEGKFISFVKKSAKLRAPRFSGQLAESIVSQQVSFGTWELTVESPYGWFQEHGWNARFLPAFFGSRSGYLISDWMQAKGKEGSGIMPSGAPHAFITPAFESGISHLPSMLQEAVYTGAKKSAKGGVK